MGTAPRILAFAGSTRMESVNKRLVKIAAAGATGAGGDVTLIDLRDYPLPLYDGDLEERDGLPANARTLKDLVHVRAILQNIRVLTIPEQVGSFTCPLAHIRFRSLGRSSFSCPLFFSTILYLSVIADSNWASSTATNFVLTSPRSTSSDTTNTAFSRGLEK